MNTNALMERWEKYRRANFDQPSARENELAEIFRILDPKVGEKIWELGTGNGYLTFPLAEAVRGDGEVVTTDVEEGNISAAIEKNGERRLPIVPLLVPIDASPILQETYKEYFDAVASVATLHHCDNRNTGSGSHGREMVLREMYLRLKVGGRLVIGDPLHGTITQKYFDAIDDPEYCAPEGHPFDFFTRDQLFDIMHLIGFRDIQIIVRAVPWKFASEEEAIHFVHTIHNARVSPEISFERAKSILGWKKIENHFELGWELFFLSARK